VQNNFLRRFIISHKGISHAKKIIRTMDITKRRLYLEKYCIYLNIRLLPLIVLCYTYISYLITFNPL